MTRQRRPRSESSLSLRAARSGGAAVLLAAVLAAAAGVAQEMQRREVVGGLAFLDEVEVTVVNLDVFVRDKDDRVVTGLDREDFRLLVDGQERPLSNFAAYTEQVIAEVVARQQEREPGALPVPTPQAEAPAEAAQPSLPDVPVQPVHVVLFVDNENLRPFDRNRVLPQVVRFLRTIMLPHVQVMVVSAERSVRVVQGFTSDIKQVDTALRELRTVYGGRSDDDLARNRLIRDMQAVEDQSRTGRGQPTSREALLVEERINTYGEEQAFELNYTVSGIREITTSLAGLPGRKILIHISSGLPMVPARDLVTWWGEIFQQRSTLPMMTRFNRSYLYEALGATANAQGVSFYTIDATGLGGVVGGSAENLRPVDPMVTNVYVINNQEPLQYLAETTGGRAILDSNDVAEDLAELRDDLFTYYSLGYNLSKSGGDTVHRVQVELPQHPEYRLVYRRTFVEKSIESRVQDAVVSGLVLDVDENPMGIILTAGAPRPASEDRWVLPIEISFPIESVALLPTADEYSGTVVAFLGNRNTKGRQSDIQRREFDIRMPARDYEQRRNERFTAAFDLLMEEGVHRVVVGLLDPVTRQASYATLVQAVPAGGGS